MAHGRISLTSKPNGRIASRVIFISNCGNIFYIPQAYLPKQHFAVPGDHRPAGVRLYDQLAEENPEWPVFADGFAAYARLHRDIIARFGRFPHRSQVLNRKSTPEEAEYLAGDVPAFGQ